MLPPSRYNGGVPYSLRDFKSEDFDTLWRIDQQCFAPGISYSRRELDLYLHRPRAFALVAEETEARQTKKDPPQVVGFIVAEAGNRGAGHIITIDVLEKARRSGAGSQLLLAAEARLKAAGCQSSVLETAVDNLSALSFYKRHGYVVIRTFPRYYSNGVDALVLAKKLDAGAEARRA